MQFFLTFLPWIAYGVARGPLSWTQALLIALVLAVAVWARDLVATRQVDVLGTGGVVFFAGLLVASVAGAPASVAGWTDTLSYAWIALLMWLSLAVRRPFTLAASRREAPPEAWDTAYFRTMNSRITTQWALSFTVGTLALPVLSRLGVGAGPVIVQVACIVVPALAMRRHIAVAEAEGEKAAAAGAAAVTDGPAAGLVPA